LTFHSYCRSIALQAISSLKEEIATNETYPILKSVTTAIQTEKDEYVVKAPVSPFFQLFFFFFSFLLNERRVIAELLKMLSNQRFLSGNGFLRTATIKLLKDPTRYGIFFFVFVSDCDHKDEFASLPLRDIRIAAADSLATQNSWPEVAEQLCDTILNDDTRYQPSKITIPFHFFFPPTI